MRREKGRREEKKAGEEQSKEEQRREVKRRHVRGREGKKKEIRERREGEDILIDIIISRILTLTCFSGFSYSQSFEQIIKRATAKENSQKNASDRQRVLQERRFRGKHCNRFPSFSVYLKRTEQSFIRSRI